jgi:glycosyltransferase involved in cell wall biosynthesis
MDGGSTDGTLELLQKYGSKIIWKSEKDNGQADAINKGLKMSSGEILAYLNSDDVYEPKAFLKVADFFKKNPQTNWAFGKCKIISEKGSEIRGWVTAYKNFFLKRYSYNSLLVLDYISQPAVFWTRKAMDEFGLFDEGQYYELDYEYWLRIGKKCKPGFINDYLASFRIHTQAKTGSHFVKHYWQEFQVACLYTKNPFLLFLHFLNFLSIIGSYSILSLAKK